MIEFLVETGPDGESRPNLEGVGPGSRVAVEGPAGGFVLPRRLPRDLLFIAGGTGIAPLRAMMASALARRNPPSITLIYSARTPVEFAFSRRVAPAFAPGADSAARTVTRERGCGVARAARADSAGVDQCLREGPRPAVLRVRPRRVRRRADGHAAGGGSPIRRIGERY